MKILDNHFDLNVSIPIMAITHSISRDDAHELIKAIDLRFAECDFTLDVIKYLVDSLRGDMTDEEIKTYLKL
jgi:hypothetical protein